MCSIFKRTDVGSKHVFDDLEQAWLDSLELGEVGFFEVAAHLLHVRKVTRRNVVLPLKIRWLFGGTKSVPTCNCSKILSSFAMSSFFFFSLPIIEGICLRSSAMI